MCKQTGQMKFQLKNECELRTKKKKKWNRSRPWVGVCPPFFLYGFPATAIRTVCLGKGAIRAELSWVALSSVASRSECRVASAVPGALTLAHERGCPLTPSQHPLFTHGEPPFEWLPVQFCCQPWGRRSAVCWTPAIPESRLQGASVQRGSRLHLAVSQRTWLWVDFPFTLGAPGTQGYSVSIRYEAVHLYLWYREICRVKDYFSFTSQKDKHIFCNNNKIIHNNLILNHTQFLSFFLEILV